MTQHRPSRTRTGLVYGSSGFVGRAVGVCLASHGFAARAGRAPRLRCVATTVDGVSAEIDETVVDRVCAEIGDSDVVVNAAGLTPETEEGVEAMMGANALFAAVLATAAERTGVRLVHVSSSAVQGDASALTADGPLRPYNTYSLSKALGERLVQRLFPAAVSLRPGSVHGFDRPMTRRIAVFAHSNAAFTLAPGTAPTPQMHVRNVAAAICHLASTRTHAPGIVLQPHEGFTTGGFLELMGRGRSPHLVPQWVGRLTSWACAAGSQAVPRVAQHARRVELLMSGQKQEDSWLVADGFRLPYSHEDWLEMVERIHGHAGPR